MVAPHDFEFNEETSHDNEFQKKPAQTSDVINRLAMTEFQGMVETLRRHGVRVVIPEARTTGSKTPDAVFPNNWFATEHDGTVMMFPMAPVGRRGEKNRITAVERALMAEGFRFRNIINIGHFYETEHFLEGTGCMVIDHPRKMVYAARSERCHDYQLENFAQLRGYKTMCFSTSSHSGKPIYHTNVMLSVGEQFAVVCAESLTDPNERSALIKSLSEHHEIMEITLEQVEKNICGNILQLRGGRDQPLVVMSQKAFDGFTEAQREFLSHHGELVPVRLDTIESVGGGSARCMIAEVFLPRVEI